MVQSKAKSVDAYLAELDVDVRPAVARIRAIAKKTLPGFDESMRYRMPTYDRDEEHAIAFASQKQYVAIYPGPKVLSEVKKEVGPFMSGKGCVRFSNVNKIDWALVEAIFRAAAK